MHIQSVIVLDWYGGPHYVPVADYYKYTDPDHNQLGPKYRRPATAAAPAADREKRRGVHIHLEQDTNDVVIEM